MDDERGKKMNSTKTSRKECIQIASKMLNLTVADFMVNHPILVERLNDVERMIQRVKGPAGVLRSTQAIATIVCVYLESEGKKLS